MNTSSAFCSGRCIEVQLDGSSAGTLQAFRAVQALMETAWHVHVDRSLHDLWRVSEIKGETSRLGLASSGIKLPVTRIELDHESPEVRIGTLSRPLFFPEWLLDELEDCEGHGERTVGVSFLGLITKERRKMLRDWRKANSTRRLSLRLGESEFGKLSIRTTSRGRSWPDKAHDESYFSSMLQSQYVLCPPGDFAWTYRTFEAAMCGSIPIVTDRISLYDGLVVGDWHDPHSYPEWSPEVARHNRQVVRQLLVPGKDLLEAEIGRLIDGSSS